MLSFKTLGTVTRPRTAIAFIAATLLIGGTATEASAKSRHHRHHHRHHAAQNEPLFERILRTIRFPAEGPDPGAT